MLTETLKQSDNLYTVVGSSHMKFTDIGLYIGSSWLRNLVQIDGKTDPARILVVTSALTKTFFDQHLKSSAVTPESLLQTYRELQKVSVR